MEVTLRSGATMRFAFVAFEGEVLRGEDVEVMISQVDRATVIRNPVKPGAMKVVAGIVVVTVVVAAALLYEVAKGFGEEE